MELSSRQQENAALIAEALQEKGITNPLYHAAVLGITYKESGLVPQSEKSYSNTSVARIRQVFPTKTAPLSDSDIEKLKQSDNAFFDYFYGNKYGNTSPGDGYRYRGRGFNQVTFKGNYQSASKHTGVDLIKDPDELNKPKVAARALAGYFIDTMNPTRLQEYGLTSLNNIKDLGTAIRIAMRQNAGWGSSVTGNVFKEGEQRAKQFASTILDTLKKKAGTEPGLAPGSGRV
jgi:predicted chitinase